MASWLESHERLWQTLYMLKCMKEDQPRIWVGLEAWRMKLKESFFDLDGQLGKMKLLIVTRKKKMQHVKKNVLQVCWKKRRNLVCQNLPKVD